MMNNPMMQIMSAMRSGQNPMQMMQRMAMNDPRAAQAMQIIRGKSPQELQQIARNMARERNINIDELQRSFGMK